MVVERLIYKSKSFEETIDENGRMNKQKELVLQKIAGTSPCYQQENNSKSFNFSAGKISEDKSISVKSRKEIRGEQVKISTE